MDEGRTSDVSLAVTAVRGPADRTTAAGGTVATDKFSVAWRDGQPVLDYVMRGFWTVEDAQAYVDELRSALARRPQGRWYMFGNLREMKPQSEEVNALRNEASRIALEAELSGCVVVSTSTIAKMQMQRLESDAAVSDLVEHAATLEDGEAVLKRMLAGG
jgi:hypothetical protein